MPTLFWTKGCPASGKSSHARQIVANGEAALRVSKDDLRDAFHDGKWSKENEKIVLMARDAIITSALRMGLSVVVDDTNLVPKHQERFQEIASDIGCNCECIDFTGVSLEECLKRNLNKDRQRAGRVVPEKVIRDMYYRYVNPIQRVIINERDPNKPNVIICDIDGTIAYNDGHRGWFDAGEDKVYDDIVRRDVVDVVGSLGANFGIEKVIFMSGRTERAREGTLRWLREKCLFAFPMELHMRQVGDHRPDDVMKRELFDAHVAGKYNVVAVFDDRHAVCRMWDHELGLTVFRVGRVDGDDF